MSADHEHLVPVVSPALNTCSGSNHAPDTKAYVVHGTQDPCVSDIAFAQGRNNGGENVLMQPIAIQDVRPIEKAQNGRGWNDDGTAYTVDTHATQGVAQPMVLMDQGGSVMNVEHDMVGTLRRETHGHEPVVMAPTLTASNDPSRSPQSTEVTNQVASVYAASMAVRRLTPVECERLQGFPDGYTNIPWRKKDESPDGPRYKALGNSWAVPVVAWLGKRINEAVK
jgi:DNA (cytosine-5)-methyltransferase 1